MLGRGPSASLFPSERSVRPRAATRASSPGGIRSQLRPYGVAVLHGGATGPAGFMDGSVGAVDRSAPGRTGPVGGEGGRLDQRYVDAEVTSRPSSRDNGTHSRPNPRDVPVMNHVLGVVSCPSVIEVEVMAASCLAWRWSEGGPCSLGSAGRRCLRRGALYESPWLPSGTNWPAACAPGETG
jgi:hypothetical protein